MTIEDLEKLEPEEVTDLFAAARVKLEACQGYAVYGGQTVTEINAEYLLLRNYIRSKLTCFRAQDE